MNNAEQLDVATVEEAKSESANRPDTESATTTVQRASLKGELSPVKNVLDGQIGSRAIVRSGTGPRSPMGKERSRGNALKHGLFAKVVLLSHESRAHFASLLLGLRRDLNPEGMLEEVLVEKIAMSLWRYRRFLQAESGEVRNNIQERMFENARRSDEALNLRVSMDDLTAKTVRQGLVTKIDDPHVLESCLEKLNAIRVEVDKFGFDDGAYHIDLGLVYGARYEGRPGKDLFDCYHECFGAMKLPPAEREKRGFTSQEDCITKFISATEKEIHRLEGLRKYPLPKPKRSQSTDRLQPTGIELLKCVIPNSERLDSLLRYEASVERVIERTLGQLERLQRNRYNQKTIPIAREATSS
jgi:hypothetical protein